MFAHLLCLYHNIVIALVMLYEPSGANAILHEREARDERKRKNFATQVLLRFITRAICVVLDYLESYYRN